MHVFVVNASMLCLCKLTITFLALLLIHSRLYHSDCQYSCYICEKGSFICIQFKGRYLSRRISYPSNGSFNPFVITNKEANIMNGNINNLENDKHFDQTTEISVNVNSVGTVCRNHFQNYCLTHDQKFSCAVDCFLELCYGIFWTRHHNVTRNEFFDIIYESCNSRQLFGAVETAREPVWSSIRNRCPSFLGMTANAVFSDIFTMRNVGSLSDDLKSLFLIQQRSQTCCSLCTNQIVKTAGIMVLYITSPNLRSIDFENQLSEAVLPDTGALYCDSCQSQTGDIRMQHFITMPMFLMTELSAIHINQIQFPLSIDVLGNFYSLKAVVRCASHHFTVAINSGTSWLYYDDLCMEVAEYHNFQDLLTLFSNG